MPIVSIDLGGWGGIYHKRGFLFMLCSFRVSSRDGSLSPLAFFGSCGCGGGGGVNAFVCLRVFSFVFVYFPCV